MHRTVFTARTFNPSSANLPLLEYRACTLDGDPVHFAEALASSLSDGGHLIAIDDTFDLWVFETRLKATWRDGVPVRRIRSRPA